MPMNDMVFAHSVTVNQSRTRILTYKHQELTITHVLCPAVSVVFIDLAKEARRKVFYMPEVSLAIQIL